MSEKSIAIIQSNYIPWKGYFDIVAAVDEFVFYDDVQFTKNDWRNRNKIKTPKGVEWLTIPVGSSIDRQIREVEVSDQRWRLRHWRTLEANYRRAPYFDEVATLLEPLYLIDGSKRLSEINRKFIEAICIYLEIRTPISDVSDYAPEGDRVVRLIDICRKSGATRYISGPSAKSYLNVLNFQDNGIAVEWFDYAGYPEYPQLWGGFEHGVSIVDLLFNCGPKSMLYMKAIQ